MMIQEFEDRTGFYPTQELYQVIEQAYIEGNLDKDAFCKAYRTNLDGLAEDIARKANIARIAADDKAKKETTEKISTLEAKVELLKTQLDREQEWKPYNDTHNVSQDDYERLAEGSRQRVVLTLHDRRGSTSVDL